MIPIIPSLSVGTPKNFLVVGVDEDGNQIPLEPGTHLSIGVVPTSIASESPQGTVVIGGGSNTPAAFSIQPKINGTVQLTGKIVRPNGEVLTKTQTVSVGPKPMVGIAFIPV